MHTRRTGAASVHPPAQGLSRHVIEYRVGGQRHGIPVTSPARTLIDIAGVCEPRELEPAASDDGRGEGVSHAPRS